MANVEWQSQVVGLVHSHGPTHPPVNPRSKSSASLAALYWERPEGRRRRPHPPPTSLHLRAPEADGDAPHPRPHPAALPTGGHAARPLPVLPNPQPDLGQLCLPPRDLVRCLLSIPSALSVAATGQARPRAYGAAPPRGSLSLSLGARFFSPRAAAKGSLAAPGLRASAVASHRAGLANIEGSAPPHILRRPPLQPPPPRRYGLRSSSSVDAGAAHDSCEARARRWRSPVLSAEQHGSSADTEDGQGSGPVAR
ncbi:uncharacterized protein LOC110436509 [Sorghum bicolor]|uniref:uncharacterized protein LOC110436509 n=1 Tax=Sorghum bicolor TaxID=4558 RepID=UPI000B424FE5|nr:uncharacterized protein LOC110436509 [Sorghum bicolor]|eukprot:XP_021319330.1 uncharacterized protein LOC110436509 [Sorghum bicolor]